MHRHACMPCTGMVRHIGASAAAAQLQLIAVRHTGQKWSAEVADLEKKKKKVEILARYSTVDWKSTVEYRNRFPISVLVFEIQPRSGPQLRVR
eukprot:SAG31_NODE_3984_length_3686_cov_2.132980_2_plen_93_part_00